MNHKKAQELLKLTVKNIFRRRLRSTLTIIAVIIGIATIVALIMVSNGLFNGIEGMFETMGINSIFVFPITSQGPTSSNSRLSENAELDIKDAENISKIAEVEKAYGMSYRTSDVEYRGQEVFTFVFMSDKDEADDIFDSMNLEVREGTSLQGKKGKKAIIGPYIADKMYDYKIKVGDKINISGEDFKVSGILKPLGNSDDDSAIYITREEGKDLFNLEDKVSQILVKVKEGNDPEVVKEDVIDVLEKDHEENTFQVYTAKQVLDTIKMVLNSIKVILIAIAAISVIVGSIGIVNSIFTSVIERTREIGIIKSIGAKIKDIYFIFVSESIILSVVGGIVGLGVGIGIAKTVELYAIYQNYDILHVVVTWEIIATAILLSLIIGFISGIIPSRKAAKMNTVNALKDIN